ncbi:MAG: polyprenyl synthetase family protein [Clostridiales bacterium]|nr:polyprenyl synthetase family protein [Clostridiales bacterium]
MRKRQQILLEQIEEKLDSYVPKTDTLYRNLIEAMRYSLLDGGKRIRPLLVLEFCQLCGGEVSKAMPFACALEMIHTYSLIHDDLPCMDNDDMRRGRPSNHKAFGEGLALLAGDALLTLAFETMLSPESIALAGTQPAAEAAGTLACAAGAHGMVGGQVIDLASEGQQIPLEILQLMDECKTGSLIVAAAEMGCILAGASQEKRQAARKYASAIGLAFQIVDDILDVTGTTEDLGKKAGSDADNQKSTYVTLLGLEKAQEAALELTHQAVEALDIFEEGEEKQGLAELAEYLASRKK